MPSKLPRRPDAIGLDAKPTNVPKGSKVVQTAGGTWEVYYPKSYLKTLEQKRTGTGKTRIGILSRLKGGSAGRGGAGGAFIENLK